MTSILLNTPAHPEAFAVTFDGFPMAQRGEAGRALGISASSTMLGGLVGCAVFVGFIQVINYLPTLFHPPEYVALITIALILVGTLGTDAASKALISGGIGLMIASIGADPVTGLQRFTFNAVGLISGVSLVALALGLFAIPQMVLVFGTATTIARQNLMGEAVEASQPVALESGFRAQVFRGIGETFGHWMALVRAGLIGVVTGIIPGIGGFAANFLSYGVAQQLSTKRELFGTGIPEGIIAPEGSSLAKEAGGLVPIIGLGIPGGVGGALFLAAPSSSKGVEDRLRLRRRSYPTLPYEMMWVIALGGLIGTTAGLLAAPLLARVTRVPGPLIVPLVMSLAIVGAFVSQVSFFTVGEVFVFAVIGFTLRRLRYSVAAFAIGLVLGPTLQANISLTHEVYPGWTFLARPFADVLFAIAIGVLASKTVQLRRDARRRADKELEKLVDPDDPVAQTAWFVEMRRSRHPYPLLAVIVTLAIAGVAVAYTVYGARHYSYEAALMPVIAGTLTGAVALWRTPIEIAAYIASRRDRRAGEAPRGAKSADGAPAPITEHSWGWSGQYTRELVAFGWSALVVGCYLFGFTIGVPISSSSTA